MAGMCSEEWGVSLRGWSYNIGVLFSACKRKREASGVIPSGGGETYEKSALEPDDATVLFYGLYVEFRPDGLPCQLLVSP